MKQIWTQPQHGRFADCQDTLLNVIKNTTIYLLKENLCVSQAESHKDGEEIPGGDGGSSGHVEGSGDGGGGGGSSCPGEGSGDDDADGGGSADSGDGGGNNDDQCHCHSYCHCHCHCP